MNTPYTTTDNPFLTPSTKPYGIPDFEAIKEEHYLPAFTQAMAAQVAQWHAIANDPTAPTFLNTIEALENSGSLLNDVCNLFFNLYECSRTDGMESIAEEITPQLTTHSDNLYLNTAIFKRVKAVWENIGSTQLNHEQRRLTEEYYKAFVRNGANVAPEHQPRLRELNKEIALLELQFGNNVLKATNDYQLVLHREQLEGMPQPVIDAARQAAAGAELPPDAYLFTLHKPSMEPFLSHCKDRQLRYELWKAYSTRCLEGNHDNRNVINKLVNLRLERAQMIGYDSHAAYVLDESMAKTPAAARQCLLGLWEPSLNKATEEATAYQAMLQTDEGSDAVLQPWDWRYYSERLREKTFHTQENVEEYFPLQNVLQGAFNVASKLYGLSFRLNPTLPTYDKQNAQAYEVVEQGSVRAILYMDFFPRASKSSGAWMTNFREQYKDSSHGNKNIIPIISIVCNFTPPTDDRPSLLNLDEAETLFHEFGHALHSILSDCTYKSLSGTNVPRDFVELPSQIMENWCRHPEVMKDYARHYKSGKPITKELLDTVQQSLTYGQGFAMTELLAAALLDLDYHTLTTVEPIDVEQFEHKSMKSIRLIEAIIPRYRSCYFQHIFTTGYSASYYSYVWTAILDADAFEAFVESGDLYNQRLASAFRHILSCGNTEELMSLYRAFRGKEPSPEALMRRKGLK